MANQVQFRRGTTTQNNAFTGAAGEITYDTDAKTLRLHDGLTAGGGATVMTTGATQTVLNKTFSTGSAWQGTPVALAYGGTGSALTAAPGAVPYSTASGMGLSLAGTSGQILVSGGTGSPTWVSGSTLTVGTATVATSATNIQGGSAGQLMIQADTNLTTFITAGAVGTFLQSAGAGYAPTWAAGQVTYGNTTVSLGGNSAGVLNGITTLNSDIQFIPLPTGNTAQRPGGAYNSISPQLGHVRYNTQLSSFEGYGAGNAWSSLGGVTSVDKYAYITAEAYAGAADDVLRFYAGDSGSSTQVMWASSGNVSILSNLMVSNATVANRANTAVASANVATTLDSFVTTTYRSAKYLIQATAGAAYQTMEVILVQDGTTPTLATYGVVKTGANLGTVTTTISAGSVLLQFVAANANTNVRVMKTYMVI
jgi:hypothetical protein